jgi:hypothetical protein
MKTVVIWLEFLRNFVRFLDLRPNASSLRTVFILLASLIFFPLMARFPSHFVLFGAMNLSLLNEFIFHSLFSY